MTTISHHKKNTRRRLLKRLLIGTIILIIVADLIGVLLTAIPLKPTSTLSFQTEGFSSSDLFHRINTLVISPNDSILPSTSPLTSSPRLILPNPFATVPPRYSLN